MWARSCARFVLQRACDYLHAHSFSLSARTNTVVVERWWKVPLSREGRPPRLYTRRHRVYRLVEDIKHRNQEKMELLLTHTVPKLGGRGDTVFVKKSVGRNKLLAEGLAVYPSPDNKEMFTEERRLLREGKKEDRIQTRTGQLTVEFLKKSILDVGIPTTTTTTTTMTTQQEQQEQQDFLLTKEIICRYFLRKLGVVVPPHAVTLPDEPITQFGDFWCDVTVNGLDTVRVQVTVGPYVDPQKKKRMKQDGENASITGTITTTPVSP